MKQIKLMLASAFLLTMSVAFGQSEKTISPMKDGTVLTDSDIGFLSMVANADLSASRGSSKKEATIKNVSYSAGKTLSNADAKSITTAILDFQQNYKAPDGSRGTGWCYYWYYYCDAWGYCYYYKYWYYC
ncbi:MAG: hypothetical protein ABIP79_11905 [Chitinophagaceae bacterium]